MGDLDSRSAPALSAAEGTAARRLPTPRILSASAPEPRTLNCELGTLDAARRRPFGSILTFCLSIPAAVNASKRLRALLGVSYSPVRRADPGNLWSTDNEGGRYPQTETGAVETRYRGRQRKRKMRKMNEYQFPRADPLNGIANFDASNSME